jgi:hypothetical protein
VDAPSKFSAADVTQSGNCLNDLGSIIALPAVWAGAGPSQIVSTLGDALIGMLRLSFVCVRLSDSEGRPSTEMMRVADSVGRTDRAQEIREAIGHVVGRLTIDAAFTRSDVRWRGRSVHRVCGSRARR